MDYREYFGIGVAGNFTGHLEQANEAKDFESVEVTEKNQPKAIFPFYMPNLEGSFLEKYPISSSEIILPDTPHDVQIEPEVALICDVIYDGETVTDILVNKFAAYNDCSIRRPDAKKISHKKNWGESSKGISNQVIDVDSFTKEGILNNFAIASFHVNDSGIHQYGETSDVSSYSYCYEKLMNWIKDKLNNQADVGPAEKISDYLKGSNFPKKCIISIGATRYTPYGEKNFLAKGDKSIVAVFDKREHSESEIIKMIEASKFEASGVSFLVQSVV